MEATEVDREKAEAVLEETNYDVKLSILMIMANLSKEEGKELLEKNNGYIAKALSK